MKFLVSLVSLLVLISKINESYGCGGGGGSGGGSKSNSAGYRPPYAWTRPTKPPRARDLKPTEPSSIDFNEENVELAINRNENWIAFQQVMRAFDRCESNNNPGLTWEELEPCEKEFCKDVVFECPNEMQFKSMDLNSNGIVTVGEFMKGHFGHDF